MTLRWCKQFRTELLRAVRLLARPTGLGPIYLTLSLTGNGCQSDNQTGLLPLPSSPVSTVEAQPGRSDKTRSEIAGQTERIRQLLAAGVYDAVPQQLELLFLLTLGDPPPVYPLFQAQLALAQGELTQLEAFLSETAMVADSLSREDWVTYLRLSLEQATREKQAVSLIRARIALSPYLSSREAFDNQKRLWQQILSTSPELLEGIVLEAEEQILQGWLALKALYFQWGNRLADPNNSTLAHWIACYPEHPLTDASMRQALLFDTPLERPATHRAALFLPLSGPNAPNGEVVKAGALAAQQGTYPPIWRALQRSSYVTQSVQPLRCPTPLELICYDVHDEPSLSEALVQAHADEVSLIIGPVSAKLIEQMKNAQTEQIALFLNAPKAPTEQISPQHFYLAAQPLLQGKETARLLWRKGCAAPLLLLSRDSRYLPLAQAFVTEWSLLTGRTPTICTFKDFREVQKGINHRSRAAQPAQLESLFGQRSVNALFGPTPLPSTLLPAESFLGQYCDLAPSAAIDALYILGSEEERIQLKALFDRESRHLKKPLPIVTTLTEEELITPYSSKLELEGVLFNEPPLLAGVQLNLSSTRALQTRYKHRRFPLTLFALGMDAYLAAEYLLFSTEGFRYHAAPSAAGGTMWLSGNEILFNHLTWLHFSEGRSMLSPPVNGHTG